MVLFVGFAPPALAQERPPETEQQRRVAAQMAAWMDEAGEAAPPEEVANLRVMLLQNGEPFGVEPSVHGAFAFRGENAARGQTITQSFNPNANGRGVYEGLAPGTYDLYIEGQEGFAGWSWTASGVLLEGGEAPRFEIALVG